MAVIELDERELSAYDVRPWEQEEFLTAGTNLDPGEEVFVLTYPPEYGDAPVPRDVSARIDVVEHQILASDRGAIITKPLYHGASGSPVYRAVEVIHPRGELEPGTPIQLVGVFTGALPPEEPEVGHFHYIDTAAEIIRARRDCLDEKGVNFRR